MNRETKVGLVVGLGIVLLIGIVVSDHLSVVQKHPMPKLIKLDSPAGSGDSARVGWESKPGYLEQTDNQLSPSTGNPRTGEFTPNSNSPQRILPIPTPQELDVQSPRTEMETEVKVPAVVARKETTPAESTGDGAPDTINKENGNGNVKTRTKIIHRVQAGETLWLIAQRYYGRGEVWRRIAKANPRLVQANGWVQVGSRLIVSFDQNEEERSGQNVSTSASKTKSDRPIRVVAGDTLSRLAARYLGAADRWPEIMAANREMLTRPEHLREGMTLRLPTTTSSLDPPRSAPKQVRGSDSPTYTVRTGDTLSSIARRVLNAPDRWNEIHRLNRRTLSHPDDLRVGQVLVLPRK